MSDYPKEFLDLLESVSDKRPRTVIRHILKMVILQRRN